MPKKPQSLKEQPLRKKPIGKNKKALKEVGPEESIGEDLSIPDFPSLIDEVTYSQEKSALPPSEYYDLNDPRCLSHKGFICKVEKYRERINQAEGSKFFNKSEELQMAIHEIYNFLRMHVGYRPAWLFDEIDDILSKVGRPETYSSDDRLIGSKLISILLRYGSKKNQATSLLSLLNGNTVVTDGYMKDFGDSHKEYAQCMETPEDFTPTRIGETLAKIGHHCSLKKVRETKIPVGDAYKSLSKACQTVLDYMRDYRHLVEEFDTGHSEQHELVIRLLDSEHSDVVEYFIPVEREEDISSISNELRRQLIDYLNTIELFLETKEK